METEARKELVRARMLEMRSDAEASARPCSQCMFGPIDGSGHGMCDFYGHWNLRHDRLNGRTYGGRDVTTAEARSATGYCGPEGLLFKPYTIPRRIARAVARADAFTLIWLGAGLLSATGAAAITLLGLW